MTDYLYGWIKATATFAKNLTKRKKKRMNPRAIAGNAEKKRRKKEAQTVILRWLSCQMPGVLGSVLGMFSLVSVYCESDGKFDLHLLSQCGST